MSETVLARQYIRDTGGNPIGVILSLEEFRYFQTMIEQRDLDAAEKIRQIKEAASDPAFLTDLEDAMAAFEAVDGEWWDAGLSVDSIALCYQLRTLDKSRLLERLGEVSGLELRSQIMEAMRFQLDL